MQIIELDWLVQSPSRTEAELEGSEVAEAAGGMGKKRSANSAMNTSGLCGLTCL